MVFKHFLNSVGIFNHLLLLSGGVVVHDFVSCVSVDFLLLNVVIHDLIGLGCVDLILDSLKCI